MRAFDQRRAGGRGKVFRLLHQAAHRLGSRAEFPGIAGEARGVVDDARHRRGGQRAQGIAPTESGDQARVLRRAFWRPVDLAFEVGVDLEQRKEIRVEFRQQVIDDPLADQDHLDVERDRLGFELHRAAESDQLGQRFDPYLA